MNHRFEATEPASFHASFESASEKASELNAPLFLHVRGSWCGDCRRTDSAIQAAFARLTKPAVVLTVQVSDMFAYRSPSFPYRTNELLNITAIPTVIRVGVGRLVEAECYDQAKLASLIHD